MPASTWSVLQHQSFRDFGCVTSNRSPAVLDINLWRGTSEVIVQRLSSSGTPFVAIIGYTRLELLLAFKAASFLIRHQPPCSCGINRLCSTA
jgi:hypothetical protein